MTENKFTTHFKNVAKKIWIQKQMLPVSKMKYAVFRQVFWIARHVQTGRWDKLCRGNKSVERILKISIS